MFAAVRYRGKLSFETAGTLHARGQGKEGSERSGHDYKVLNIDCAATLQILTGILAVYFALQEYCS